MIEILISKEGQATIQTRGFAGSSCQDASKFLEQALGARAGEQLTPEFYQSTSIDQPQQQRA